MDDRILMESYTPRDAADAIGTRRFDQLRTNLARPVGPSQMPSLLLPQYSGSGKRGLVYKYGHIFELAVHRYLTELSKSQVRAILFQAFNRSLWSQRVLDKINQLNADDKHVVLRGGSFSREEDPFQFGRFVDFAPITFAPDVLSRDPNKPLFWIAKARSVVEGGGVESVMCDFVEVDGDETLVEGWQKFIAATTAGSVDAETAALLTETAHGPVLINVTAILNAIDSRLAFRLRARQLGAGE